MTNTYQDSAYLFTLLNIFEIEVNKLNYNKGILLLKVKKTSEVIYCTIINIFDYNFIKKWQAENGRIDKVNE